MGGGEGRLRARECLQVAPRHPPTFRERGLSSAAGGEIQGPSQKRGEALRAVDDPLNGGSLCRTISHAEPIATCPDCGLTTSISPIDG